MKTSMKHLCNVFLMLAFTTTILAQDAKDANANYGFFAKPFGGFSVLSGFDAKITNGTTSENLSISPKFGFATGATIGYVFSNNFRIQAGWEYKTNAIDAKINNITYQGDYAANTISLEGVYVFNSNTKWQPYVGLGISTIEEVDIDLQIDTTEESFATTGLFGFQGVVGANYVINEKLFLDFELRNTRFSEFEMDAEESSNTSQLTNLKYNPITFHFGVTFRF